MKLVQVCNVGSVTGGTAACAWSVTRSLPDWDHEVIFLNAVRDETRRVFHPTPVVERTHVHSCDVAGATVVLLHNTPPERCGRLSVPTIAYRHSCVSVAESDVTVNCSRWLAGRSLSDRVLWQGVSRPRAVGADVRPLRDALVIGRLCTPRDAKWPTSSVDLVSDVAKAVPGTAFEFVGCPPRLEDDFRRAAFGRVKFVKASWQARERLTDWDVMLYSNRSVTESFGRTVAESLRAGCIPVVDACGGFVEQLDAGGGRCCETTQDFVAAIDRLADPVERRKVSREAVEIGNMRFSLAAFRERLLSVLEPLIT